MADPDRELELLEREFPESQKAWIKDTPIELDERILHLALRHSPYLEAQHQLKIERKKLDSGFVAAEGLPPAGVSPMENFEAPMQDFMAQDTWMDKSRLPRSSASASSIEPPPPPGAEKVLVMLGKAPQQEWLDSIASIVQLGDIKLALYLLQKYQEQFGDS